ncbi:MAG: RnfH family protein [Gammaproteobacteria bacterium]|nr:RnfH family protein [Gammaproteobacteria bacterium]
MASVESNKILIEVAYALPQEQVLLSLEVDEGTTLEQAVVLSGILQQFPDIELGKTNKVGIFGKLGKLDTVLREKDRVEIYRPLIADPKAVRKKRAAEGKQMRKGGGDDEAAATDESATG